MEIDEENDIDQYLVQNTHTNNTINVNDKQTTSGGKDNSNLGEIM